jgi:hypothetical protein
MTGRVQTMGRMTWKSREGEERERRKKRTLRRKRNWKEKGQSERGKGYSTKRKVEEKRKNTQRIRHREIVQGEKNRDIK